MIPILLLISHSSSTLSKLIIIIIIIYFFASFKIFHRSLREGKFLLDSRTLLSILGDLYNALLLMVTDLERPHLDYVHHLVVCSSILFWCKFTVFPYFMIDRFVSITSKPLMLFWDEVNFCFNVVFPCCVLFFL